MPIKRRHSKSSGKDKDTMTHKKRHRIMTPAKKHRKRVLTHKRKPQITVVYGRLHSKTCFHCIELDPIWTQLVDHFERFKQKIPYSRVVYKDVSVERNQLDIGIAETNNTYLSNSPTKIESPMGFPTIFRIYDGKLEYFNGNRDYNTLVRWFSRGPPAITKI